MTDQTPIETGTELSLPPQNDFAAVFKGENALDPIISKLEAAARAEAKSHDASTPKGRKALRSLANTVSSKKAELDRQGKALTEEQRKEINAVNAGRKLADDRLSKLRDEIKQPAEEWDANEASRVAAINARLQRLRDAHVEFIDGATSEAILGALARVEALLIDDTWDEFSEEAKLYKSQAIATLSHMADEARKREADAAELAELRAAAEARRSEDEAREAAEAERKAAEMAEAARAAEVEAARQRAADSERARVEAAERAKADAEEAAALREREAEERHARELQEAKAREERAAQAERDRIEAQAKAERDAAERRSKDEAHRSKIKSQIVDALAAMAGKATPEAIAEALMNGKIPHTKVAL